MVQSVTARLASEGSPALVPVQSISWARGADGSVEITVTDDAGDPVNLTGRAVALGVRTSDTATSPVFVRAAVLTDAANGVCVAYLTAADTAELTTGSYRYDIWLTDDDGRRQILKSSEFKVLEADTRPGEDAGASTPIPPMTNGNVETVEDLDDVDTANIGPGFLLWVVEEDAFYRWTGTEWVRGLGDTGAASSLPVALGTEWTHTCETADDEEVVDDQPLVDFDGELSESVSEIVCVLLATAKVNVGEATLRVYAGGTRGAADGDLLAEATVTSTGYASVNVAGDAVERPVGGQLVKLSIANDTVGAVTSVLTPRASLRAA